MPHNEDSINQDEVETQEESFIKEGDKKNKKKNRRKDHNQKKRVEEKDRIARLEELLEKTSLEKDDLQKKLHQSNKDKKEAVNALNVVSD